MRKQIAAANWKMNLTYAQSESLIDEIINAPHHLAEHQEVIFAIPFPYLTLAVDKFQGKKNVFVAAQNCSNKLNGAYTGEVSVEMLKSIGVNHVVIGHSERREYYREDNAFLAEKLSICLANQVTPIFCCGEPLSIRESATQNEYVSKQLEGSLYHLNADEIAKIIIAYEPIWAIGTGKTASSAQTQEIHAFIRSCIATKYGATIANTIPILYGGSVKAANANELFGQTDVDGGLVGGASLQSKEFVAIIDALK